MTDNAWKQIKYKCLSSIILVKRFEAKKTVHWKVYSHGEDITFGRPAQGQNTE